MKEYGGKIMRRVTFSEKITSEMNGGTAFQQKSSLPSALAETCSRELQKAESPTPTSIFEGINQNQLLKMPNSARIEGGDVLLRDDCIFIGYSKEEDFNRYKVARTNTEGVDFIKQHFPNKKVIN